MASNRLTLRLEYEKCRVWGHAWSDFRPDKRSPGWGERFSLRCDRCATERHDLIDALGELSSRHYDYPSDYRMSADETPSRQSLRLELLHEIHRPRRR